MNRHPVPQSLAEWIAFGYVLILVGIGLYAGVWLRFENPDMPATRLFLTYWPWYGLFIGLAIGGQVAWTWWEKRQ